MKFSTAQTPTLFQREIFQVSVIRPSETVELDGRKFHATMERGIKTIESVSAVEFNGLLW